MSNARLRLKMGHTYIYRTLCVRGIWFVFSSHAAKNTNLMMVCLYSYIYILYTKVVIKWERRPCVAIHNIHVLEESIAPMLPHSRAPRVYDDDAGWAGLLARPTTPRRRCLILVCTPSWFSSILIVCAPRVPSCIRPFC